MIKSFRGQLLDGAQQQIRLSTNKGEIGYRIKKFQIMTQTPYNQNAAEHVMKLFAVTQGTVDGEVDFENQQLLGVSITINNTTGYQNFVPFNGVIFDSAIVNQDIFLTHIDVLNSEPCNYYIELEQVKLDLNEATVATLKDMRGSN